MKANNFYIKAQLYKITLESAVYPIIIKYVNGFESLGLKEKLVINNTIFTFKCLFEKFNYP